MDSTYDPAQTEALARALAGGERPRCPRCETPMSRRDVPPRGEVSYVRDRIWLLCGSCGGTAVLDRRRIEGLDPE